MIESSNGNGELKPATRHGQVKEMLRIGFESYPGEINKIRAKGGEPAEFLDQIIRVFTSSGKQEKHDPIESLDETRALMARDFCSLLTTGKLTEIEEKAA